MNNPNEKIKSLNEQITALREELKETRQAMPPQEVKDYELKTSDGNSVMLSSLFGDKEELMVIHNMGKGCKYCTLWADNLTGVAKALRDRLPTVLASPDAPEVMKEFAESRNWDHQLVSTQGSTFKLDTGFATEDNMVHPGVAYFKKDNGKMYQVASDYFGPGDAYCGVWHLFDLIPEGHAGWQPKYVY